MDGQSAPLSERGADAAEFRNAGAGYYHVLKQVHAFFRPKSYLEIGVDAGHAFALANCPSIAIDPTAGRLEPGFIGTKPFALFYQMSADEFFARHDAASLLGRRVDFAFLDGMHLFEYLLRDFFYVESVAEPGSIIAMHDCMPPDLHMGRRDPSDMRHVGGSAYAEGWGGDVWKVVCILRKHRPDLEVHCFDADPTGLVMVTNLNPSSTVLRDRYFNIVREYRSVELETLGLAGFRTVSGLVRTQEIETLEKFSRYFWPRA